MSASSRSVIGGRSMSTWGGVAQSWSIATTMEWYGWQMHKQAGSSKVIFLYSSFLSPSVSSSGLPLRDAYTDSSRESRKHIACLSLVPQETQQRGNQTCEYTLQRWLMLLGEGGGGGFSAPRVMTEIDHRAVFSCALNFVDGWWRLCVNGEDPQGCVLILCFAYLHYREL